MECEQAFPEFNLFLIATSWMQYWIVSVFSQYLHFVGLPLCYGVVLIYINKTWAYTYLVFLRIYTCANHISGHLSVFYVYFYTVNVCAHSINIKSEDQTNDVSNDPSEMLCSYEIS